MKTPTAAFLPANMDGCALYRQFIPHLNISGSRFIFELGPVPYSRFAEADVVVVQRQVTQQNLKAIQQMKASGLKIIYDTDDNLWSLQASNPHKELFDEYQDGFGMCAMECHAITVSTRGLQSAVKGQLPRFKGEILVCPNAMDFNLFQPASVKKDPNKIVIGWAGSNTHAADVKDAWKVLPDVMKEHDNVYMEFIGEVPPPSLLGHPRVRIRRFVPVGEFMSRLSSWGWDITLAPLDDNRFNRSKSNIKMLEAGALGIPILISSVQPYEEFCALGDLNWLKCDTAIQWKNKLSALINDADMRKMYGERIKRVSQQWFDIKKLKDNWIHAFQTVMQC